MSTLELMEISCYFIMEIWNFKCFICFHFYSEQLILSKYLQLFNKNVSTVFGAVITKMWSCLNFHLENSLFVILCCCYKASAFIIDLSILSKVTAYFSVIHITYSIKLQRTKTFLAFMLIWLEGTIKTWEETD